MIRMIVDQLDSSSKKELAYYLNGPSNELELHEEQLMMVIEDLKKDRVKQSNMLK